MEMKIEAPQRKLVLRKLNRIMHGGLLLRTGEVRYVYEWDKSKNKKLNLQNVAKEDAALHYFELQKVIDGSRTENEFRNQQLHGNVVNKAWGVWNPKVWKGADPARREYDQEVHIYGIDYDRFKEELVKFGLSDRGDELVEVAAPPAPTPTLPPVVAEITPSFSIHKGNLISYNGKEIILEPQPRRIAARVMTNFAAGRHTPPEEITNDILSESYMEKAKTSKQVKQRVTDSIYELRAAFKTATGTDKNRFPNTRGVGYTFSP